MTPDILSVTPLTAAVIFRLCLSSKTEGNLIEERTNFVITNVVDGSISNSTEITHSEIENGTRNDKTACIK